VHEKQLDAAIGAWTESLTSAQVLEVLEKAVVPSGPIYSVVDMLGDPHFNARGLFEEVQVNGEALKIPAMMPFLSSTPGRTDWPGAAVGQHNDEVLGELLGYGADERQALSREGVI
jgi:crotonobetainyl-CoA:carnitine CoA-transferase CaiB-like acyl-CoA transferase